MARSSMVLWVRLAVLASWVVGQASPARSPSELDGAYHYSYFKQPVPLTLDGSRIAVFQDRSRPRDGLSAALSRAHVHESSLTALPIAGWSVVMVPPDQRAGKDIENLVQHLAADHAVDFVSPVFIGSEGGDIVVTPCLMIGVAELDGRSPEDLLKEQGAGAVTDRDWTGMKGVYRTIPTSRNGFEVLELANRLAQRPEIRFAEPDVIFTGRGGLIPNDPGFGNCWGLHNTGQSGGMADKDMDAPEAWDVTTGDPSIIVVVIDTGVQQNHPDINQVPGADFTGEGGGGGPVNACDNHGTAVAGCVSATINNGLGTVGVAPGCRSASARAFISSLSCNGSWTSQASWTVNALAWAQSIGARVTNNSNGYGFTSSAIEQKYIDTRSAGIVHFACAGNNGVASLWYPASLTSVNAVASLDRTGARSSFSNYGPGIDFSAPGRAIYTTDRTGAAGWVSGDYVSADGTSFASPYAAGVAALALSFNAGLSASEVEQVLQQSCVDLGTAGYDTNYGWGFVNAALTVAGTPCVSDFDSNEFVNGDDFDAFVLDFVLGLPSADANGDSFVSGEDFDYFVQHFVAGC